MGDGEGLDLDVFCNVVVVVVLVVRVGWRCFCGFAWVVVGAPFVLDFVPAWDRVVVPEGPPPGGLADAILGACCAEFWRFFKGDLVK